MSITARTVPIALVLGGVALITAALSSYAYAAVNLYAYRDSFFDFDCYDCLCHRCGYYSVGCWLVFLGKKQILSR